ncbi:hypothetical protein FO519_008266 [Halicephalobus sp. NKZ332]|nr:hypothetical protein FO519_008266 [Halicephalobus sp. NKZ332]
MFGQKRLIEITKVDEYEEYLKLNTLIGIRHYVPLRILNRIFNADGTVVEASYLVDQKSPSKLQYTLNITELTDENAIMTALREIAILKQLGIKKHIMGLFGEFRHRQYVGMLFPAYIPIRGHIEVRLNFKKGESDDGRFEEINPELNNVVRRWREDNYKRQVGLFTREAVAHVLKRVVKGLKYIHSKGIVHTELCANNVFINVNGNIKIGGFCLADGEKYEEATFAIDSWALGLLTLELITGKRRYLKDKKAVRLANEYLSRQRPLPTLGDIEKNSVIDGIQTYDPHVDDFVSKLMNLNPKQRMDTEKALVHPFISKKTNKDKVRREWTMQVDSLDPASDVRSLYSEMATSQGSNPELNDSLLKNIMKALDHVQKGDYQIFKEIHERKLCSNYIGIEASVAIPYDDKNWSRDVLDESNKNFDEDLEGMQQKRAARNPYRKELFFGASGHPTVSKDYQRYEVCFFVKKNWGIDERQIFIAIQFGRWFEKGVIHFSDLVRVVDEVDEVINDYAISKTRIVEKNNLPEAVYFASPMRAIKLDPRSHNDPNTRYLEHIYVDVALHPDTNVNKLKKLKELMEGEPNTFPVGVVPLQSSVCFHDVDPTEFEALEAQMLGEMKVAGWEIDELQREADATRPETKLYRLLYERRRNYNKMYNLETDGQYTNQARTEKIFGDFRRDYLFKVCKWAIPYHINQESAKVLYGDPFEGKEELEKIIRGNIPEGVKALEAQLVRTKIKQEEDTIDIFKRHEDTDLKKAAIENYQKEKKDDDYYVLRNQLQRGRGGKKEIDYHKTPANPARCKWNRRRN